MDIDAILQIAQNKLRYASENTSELRDSLVSLLPPCDYDVNNIKGSSEQFVADFDVDLRTEADVREFLEKYSKVTKEDLKISNTR